MKIGLNGALLHRNVTGSERYIYNLFTNLCVLSPENEYVIYTRNPVFSHGQLPKNATERTFAAKSDMVAADFLCEPGPTVELYHMTWLGTDFVDLLPLYLARVSVLTILDLILFRSPDYFRDRAAHQEYQKRWRLAIEMADAIIAISSHTRSDILANFAVDPDKVMVVPLGVDNRFRRLKDRKLIDQVRLRYGLKKPYLFYLSTDYPHKNHKNLILAFDHLVKQKGLSAQLVFAGTRYYFENEAELKQLVNSLLLDDDIVWLDHLADEELNALYNGAEVFAYPSLDEGFGLPLLEAMACGTPVAASSAASLPEVAGDAAVFFDPVDVGDIAGTIERVWRDESLKRRLIEQGHKRCSELTWKNTAQKTLAVYAEAKRRAEKYKNGSKNKLLDYHRAMLRGLMDCYGERVEAVEHAERHLRRIVVNPSLRLYRKIKETFRKIVGLQQ